MGIQNYMPVKKITRATSLVSMAVILVSVYQFVYLPNQLLIQSNQEKAGELLDSLDGKNEIHSKFKDVNAQLDFALHQKQVQDKQDLPLQDCGQLVNQVGLSLKNHGALVEVCREVFDKGKQLDPGTKHVQAVFSCDLPQLFLILRDTDRLARNVTVSHFHLDESRGSRLCEVQIEFQIDLANGFPEKIEKREMLRP